MKKITVAGGGVLGSQIAYQVATKGYEVVVYELTDALDSAKERMSQNAESYASFAGIDASQAQGYADSITFTDDVAVAVDDADLVIESIIENADIKTEFYKTFGEAAPEKTIFGTNTSSLLPSSFMDATGRPEKYVGLHFSNPVWEKPLVEVMGTSKTDKKIVDQLVEWAKEIEMTPVVAHKEQPGYLLNSLLIPWLEGGQYLLGAGVSTVEDIDKTWILGRDHSGPFGVLDVIGFDTVLAITEAKLKADPDVEWRKNFYNIVKEKVDKGHKGRATGEGFYTYPNPEYKADDFFENDKAIQEHNHPFETVVCAGGGVLGSQVAYQVARAGFKTVLYDISDDALEAAKKRVEDLIPQVVEDINFDPEAAQKAADAIIYTSDMEEAFSQADVVIESVPESMDIKKDFYGKIQEFIKDETVLLTNTSNLRPSLFMDATGRPDKFLTLHFANRIWVKNTGEVMITEKTSEDVFKDVQAFTHDIGMVVINLFKEQPSYILNTLLSPLLSSAMYLSANGIAIPQEVDKAWKVGRGVPVGPFEMMDRIGVRTLHHSFKAVIGDSDKETDKNMLAWLDGMIERNELGYENGIGFYEYKDNKPVERDWTL